MTNDAVTCVDSLRRITSDSVQLSRIDSIIGLLNRKNAVIRRLMGTTIDVAEEQNRKIEDMMKQQDSLILIQNVTKIGSTERFADRETPP